VKGVRGRKGTGGRGSGAVGGPTREEVEPLNPVFAWFEGGDVLQFGELCDHCVEAVRNECRAWSRDTLAGLRAERPRVAHDCVYFIKWRDMEFSRDKLSKDDLQEGERDPGRCPSCGATGLRRAARVASEYGTRQNPRATFLEWCPCGHFKAVKKELADDREHCVFCGKPTGGQGARGTGQGTDGEGQGARGTGQGTQTTVFRGAMFHLECFLRLRFFLTMGEMLGVARQYMASGKALSQEESQLALAKTIETVRAFKLSGNGNVIGMNRVIHWLEGDQPVISERTVLRTKEALLAHLEATFTGEAERSVGVHILEDAYIVYDNAAAVRWITRGAYRPVRSASEFVRDLIDLAAAGKWDELDKSRLILDIQDGKCALCGATTRSHRIATGEDEKNVYACHHCWVGRVAEKWIVERRKAQGARRKA